MRNLTIHAPERKEIDAPTVFLAGPITCSRDWQEEAIGIIHSHDEELVIANPRRPKCVFNEGHENEYLEQVDWESEHLSIAGQTGCILFWLGVPKEHRCDHVYAQTTRFELGEWKTKHELQGASVVVGIEEGFSNAKYIKLRLEADCPNIVVYDNLEEACKSAALIASKKK